VSLKELPVNLKTLSTNQTGLMNQNGVSMSQENTPGCPILGDELYGKKADRLYLHAEYIEFRHPIYGDILCIQKEADFHKKI
jgi:tRNA pseudouridine32 synthase/23S rRNA pseudouridine746 synthase